MVINSFSGVIAAKIFYQTISYCMNTTLAHRLREVLLNGKWIANTNFQEQITTVNWVEATQRVGDLNTIAQLTFHVLYYLKGILPVFDGGQLEIKDQFSFDMPPITQEAEWLALVSEFISVAEQFCDRVEEMDDDQLEQPFVKEAYGTFQRNIEAQIEHSYYHLGQVSLVKKLVIANK